MNPATMFALYFARLLSQLMNDPRNEEAHRATLDELLKTNREPVTLVWDNWQLVAGGETLSPNMPGMQDLVARMAAHGIRGIGCAASAEPGHVLGAIWILARDPVIGDGGAAAQGRLVAQGATTVRFVTVAIPPAAPAAPAPPTPSSVPAVFDDFELFEPAVEEKPKPRTPPNVEPLTGASGMGGDSSGFFSLFATAKVQESPDRLLARLKSVANLDELARTMESLAMLIENAQAARKVADAADLLTGVLASESLFTDGDAKRVYSQSLRRMANAGFFRALATDLLHSRDRHARYMAIFTRFGDDAVEVLIEQLAYAEEAKDRRVLFGAIVELRRGMKMLIHMLDDGRWYVARNAAELLGEMGATDAEAGLIAAMRHEEQRVRRSAAVALAKLGTPGARAALKAALGDASPNVRIQAVIAIASRKEPQSLPDLLRVLTDESDFDVQRALLSALARFASPEAVKRLISAAEPGGRMFGAKPVEFRLAAVQALADARTPEATAALDALTKDRDREVREAATKALAPRASGPVKVETGGW